MIRSLEKMLTEDLHEIGDRSSRNLSVFKIDKRDIRSDMAIELGKKFNMSGEVQTKDSIYCLAQNKQLLAVYRNSGAFSWIDIGKMNNISYRPSLPSELEASDIANGYLKDNGWLPNNAVLDGAKANSLEIVSGKVRKREVRPNNICVDFRLELDGLKTYGPGAKIKVIIGHKGEVIGLTSAVPKVRKFKEFGNRTKGLKDMLAAKLRMPLDQIEAREAKLAYFAESYALDKKFIQPMHVFNLATPIRSKSLSQIVNVEFETHPLPATDFAPIVSIKGPSTIEIKQGETLNLESEITGGTPPYSIKWISNIDGPLANSAVLKTSKLSVAAKERRLVSHTIAVTVTDNNGMQDSHQVLVAVRPPKNEVLKTQVSSEKSLDHPCVGVEWCNIYHGVPGLADISNTDPSAQGFKNYIKGLPGWTSRFDWGNDMAWEQDFKFSNAPGGGTDYIWADNVDFAFFAGHGSSGAFYFGSNIDDHQMLAQDARWGDGILKWLVLHACNTMMANFAWTAWCNAFVGLHQMFGFHTTTEGSNPPLGSRFALWLSLGYDMQAAWKMACQECFDANTEYSVIYANQAGTDTRNDHLPGFGYVSPDPKTPNSWTYYKGSC